MVEDKQRFDSKVKEVQNQVSRTSATMLDLPILRKMTLDHQKAWCVENALHVTPKARRRLGLSLKVMGNM